MFYATLCPVNNLFVVNQIELAQVGEGTTISQKRPAYTSSLLGEVDLFVADVHLLRKRKRVLCSEQVELGCEVRSLPNRERTGLFRFRCPVQLFRVPC